MRRKTRFYLHWIASVTLLFLVASISSQGSGSFSAQPNAAGSVGLPLILNQGGLRPFPITLDQIRVFNDQLATWDMTEAQYAFSASHYAGSQKLISSAAQHLRQYNPNFLVLHYRLGQALGYRIANNACQPTGSFLSIINGDGWVQEWPGDATVQESWFYHWGGQRVYNCANGHYLMDLDNAGWRSWWSAQVIAQLQNNQDDGLFADSYSVPNYFGDVWNPSLPAVDSTLETAWAAKEHAFTDYIRGQFAGRWKWIPNIGSWITSRDPSDYTNLDGAMIEGFAGWGGGNYFAIGDWELQMNRILSLVRSDKVLIAQNYPDETDLNQRLFLMGSYLLIKGKYTYINMETSMDPEWFPEYGIDLGSATDSLPANISLDYNPIWKVYVRHFQKGLVLVNPDQYASPSIALGNTYQRVVPAGGGTVPASGAAPGSLGFIPVASLSLPAHTAVILLNSVP